MHLYLEEPSLTLCSKCGKPVLSHTVCDNCGYYNGKEVIDVLNGGNIPEDETVWIGFETVKEKGD